METISNEALAAARAKLDAAESRRENILLFHIANGVNIESLKAILGEGGNNHALFVFEVMVPDSVDMGRLRRELDCEGQKRDLRVSAQHRDIFEAVHRVNSF